MIVAFPTVSNPHSNPMRAAPAEVPRGDLAMRKAACKPLVRCGRTARTNFKHRGAGDARRAADVQCFAGNESDRLDLHHRPAPPGPAPPGTRDVERELGMGNARPR